MCRNDKLWDGQSVIQISARPYTKLDVHQLSNPRKHSFCALAAIWVYSSVRLFVCWSFSQYRAGSWPEKNKCRKNRVAASRVSACLIFQLKEIKGFELWLRLMLRLGWLSSKRMAVQYVGTGQTNVSGLRYSCLTVYITSTVLLRVTAGNEAEVGAVRTCVQGTDWSVLFSHRLWPWRVRQGHRCRRPLSEPHGDGAVCSLSEEARNGHWCCQPVLVFTVT